MYSDVDIVGVILAVITQQLNHCLTMSKCNVIRQELFRVSARWSVQDHVMHISNPLFNITSHSRVRSNSYRFTLFLTKNSGNFQVYFILCRGEYAVRDNVKKFGINKLLDSGIYKAAFPLHDVSLISEGSPFENERYYP